MTLFMHRISLAIAILTLLVSSCSSTAQTESSAPKQAGKSPVAEFVADSAFAYVKAQCDFGPRVPGTEAHSKCGDYLVKKLQSFGIDVIEQKAQLKAFDGTALNMRNIIGEINPDAQQRILLLAHWDCRPWADSDPKTENHKKPVMGANDGASGVGVLVEIARALQANKPNIGVDILFVDDEDWGDHSGDSETWALGTQYWTKNMHRDGYRPMYGILLDMVGDSNASFYQEYYSTVYAKGIVQEVWKVAKKLGYADYFKSQQGGAITDDHYFVNQAGIPCINIIDTRYDCPNGFVPYWHTIGDTIDNIDPATLKAVGQTVLTLIYSY